MRDEKQSWRPVRRATWLYAVVAESLLELRLCRADGAGAAFEVPTLVDFTTITPPGERQHWAYD
jgi:hypothetical protein